MNLVPLRAIVRSAVELTIRHDRDAVLDAILGELERLVPYDAASVLLLEGDTLRMVCGRGFRRDADLAALRFPRGRNPRLDRALRSRGTSRFTDPHEADPFDGVVSQPLDHLHSCMAAPMRVDARLIGLITADAYQASRFHESHEELLELFAALAAVAIRNADLVSDLEAARSQLQGEVTTLAQEIRDVTGGTHIVGESARARALKEEIALVGATDTAVLILGETGTGKELVARALHAASPRRDRPLIRFDASAVAPSLVESELYGHVKGAFTGAVSHRPGRFEVADGGTLFLDEIGELPLDVQPRLLRALQEHETERVGEHQVRHFDVRVIAATNRDLQAEVRRGRFRADLFHRLAVYPIRVPPLRERLDDLAMLADHFARKLAPRLQLQSVRIEPAFVDELRGYPWPGNVRELENSMERALVRARANGRHSVRLDATAARGLALEEPAVSTERMVTPAALPELHGSLKEATARFQKAMVDRVLEEHGGSYARTASALGMDRSNLFRLVRRLRGGRKSKPPRS
ncbi:MAG: nitric oxide reductase transcriptional regulator NorR [Deltaproteobacteria bacterium]|nr:nitric oxide reductase transcriptional regulator NorR [Deltaproteobacteria bacterium]